MRVTGGEWRSRRLFGPSKKMPLRPTPDALRERAFAILGDRVAGAHFLDLFAGTGAVGIEALSRGADSAVFVDHHHAATRVIRRNLEQLEDAAERSQVITRPAAKAIRDLARRGSTFDLIWADPPFDNWQLGTEAITAASSLGLLRREGLLLLECPDRIDLSSLPDSLDVRRDLSCGASRLLILEPNERS